MKCWWTFYLFINATIDTKQINLITQLFNFQIYRMDDLTSSKYYMNAFLKNTSKSLWMNTYAQIPWNELHLMPEPPQHSRTWPISLAHHSCSLNSPNLHQAYNPSLDRGSVYLERHNAAVTNTNRTQESASELYCH